MAEPEELMQQLRSKATDLLLREEYKESVSVYSQFISLCQDQLNNETHVSPDPKLQKSLCLALSNRAEARSRLREFSEALRDCDRALEIENAHFKTLLCKGKILVSLDRYAMALDCFRAAQLDAQNSDGINGYLEKCKKMEILSRTGGFDISDWVAGKFSGKAPELAEYVGPVQVRRSEISGRGLFATKAVEAGTLLFATKAIAIERSILGGEELGENAQLVMWKNFIDEVMSSSSKSHRIASLISSLSCGENESDLDVPDMSLFRPEVEDNNGNSLSTERLEKSKVIGILDVNSLVEDSISAKVLGKNRDYYGIGLWVLASFINHSCVPNSRRLHVGDYAMVHASRDVKAGEEVTFAYFDVFSPLPKRKEMSRSWGFDCGCKRCEFETCLFLRPEVREIEAGLERGIDPGNAVYRLEEGMRRWAVRGREKGFLRASFWGVYGEAYGSEKALRRWSRRIPSPEGVVESVAEAVGSDERVVKILLERLKNNNGGVVEMERAFKLGRGLYGKVMKKQALKSLLDVVVARHD